MGIVELCPAGDPRVPASSSVPTAYPLSVPCLAWELRSPAHRARVCAMSLSL